MIHYHGTPITPNAELLTLAGHHFCVSFATPRQVKTCHEIGQSVMLDNGAFTFWQGGATPDWNSYAVWAEPWLEFNTTWCVIPDVIDGTEEENDRLLSWWSSLLLPRCFPVWHLHESLERLRWLCGDYERVCFGSSGSFRTVGTDRWYRRVSDAFDTVARENGSVPWIHMLRGMSLSGDVYPFSSVDSTDIAQNHHRPHNSAVKLANRWDGIQCPARWQTRGLQTTIEEHAGRPRPDFDPHLDYPERFQEAPF